MTRPYFALLVLFLLLSLLPSFAYAAQGLVPCGYDLDGKNGYELSEHCKPCDFFSLIKRILDFVLFAIVPAIAVLMVVFGGFMFLTGGASPLEVLAGGAKGGPQGLKQGKAILTATVTGLIIVYSSWLVVNLFFVAIGVQEWTGLGGGFFSIPCTPRP